MAVPLPVVSTLDPVDLRLASAVAELGRTTVLQIAARAGVHPEEAAVRLLRMGAAGLPLVVGVEGDRAGLQGWVRAQQAPPVPPPSPPVWTEPPSPAAPPAWTPPSGPPLGWGVPQSGAWVRQPQPPQPQPPPPQPPPDSARATPTATVGDTLSSVSPTGEQLHLTLVEVVDTADALIAAAGHHLTPGSRAAVVHTDVTAGPRGYQAIPDTCLTVVLADGTEVGKSGITLSSRPPFRSGIAAGDTVGGHTVFEVDAHASIVGVRWRALSGAPPLDWRTA